MVPFDKSPCAILVLFHSGAWQGFVYKRGEEVYRTASLPTCEDAALSALAHAQQFTQTKEKS